MFPADKRFLSVCIHEATIKVAQVSSSGTVEKIARITASNATVDELAKSLKSILGPFNSKLPVICSIPASVATVKSVEVPSSDPKEIRSIINLQASRHTPYSREEVLIGSINLGNVGSGNTRVLLVIAHRNVVKERLIVLERCSLSCDKVAFASEGIGRMYAKGLTLKNNASAVGLIDISIHATNFLIVARGAIVFSRSIPIGIKQLLEPDGIAKMSEELNRSLAAYQGEEIEPVSLFLVTTDNAAVKGALPIFKETLKVDVRISPYVDLVRANAVKSKLEKDFVNDSFLDVIAPVVAAAKAEINLMPEEMVVKRAVERQSVEATKAGIGVVVIMLLLGGILMSKIYFKDEFLNKNLRENYAAQTQEVRVLEQRMEQNRIIRDYLQGRMVSLETIQELYRITPQEIYLNSVALDEDGNITIAGISPSMSQVYSYVKALDDSPMFEGAKTKSTSTKKDNDKDVAAFEVTFKLSAEQQGAKSDR